MVAAGVGKRTREGTVGSHSRYPAASSYLFAARQEEAHAQETRSHRDGRGRWDDLLHESVVRHADRHEAQATVDGDGVVHAAREAERSRSDGREESAHHDCHKLSLRIAYATLREVR